MRTRRRVRSFNAVGTQSAVLAGFAMTSFAEIDLPHNAFYAQKVRTRSPGPAEPPPPRTTRPRRLAGVFTPVRHDLDLHNLKYLISNIPFIDEVSIGHALISDALYMGLETTIKKYLDCLK